jgi:hypothetical protein
MKKMSSLKVGGTLASRENRKKQLRNGRGTEAPPTL